jgi:hypothetical protein
MRRRRPGRSPAKAGVQRRGRNDWVPAFAGKQFRSYRLPGSLTPYLAMP